MRFYLRWQRVARSSQLIGADGLARIVEQLQGFETAAGAWEREILPARLCNYEASFLDQMCLAGQVVWCRLSPRKSEITDHLEPLTTDEAAALLAQLTKVASARDTLDAFPPLLRDAIKTGERVAARAIKSARGKKPANANRRALPAWVTSRGAVPRVPEHDTQDEPSGSTMLAAIDLPDWVAPEVPVSGVGVHTNDRLPTWPVPDAARDDARGRDPAIIATIEATQTAATDAGATRQQVALAVTGVLARAFPMLEPLAAATLAFDAVFPPTPTRRNAPSRSAPLALMLRRDAAWLRAAAANGTVDEPSLSPLASKIREQLVTAGASFLPDLVGSIDAPPDAIEDALWELVGAGIATADGFASMRVLVDRRRGEVKSHFDRALERSAPAAPVRKWQEAIKKARTRDRERPAHALRALPTAAGRWSLLPAARDEALDVEASARQLLLRYGVVFRDLLARETSLPPWRDLLVVLRRLEARGEIRGGRFVNGFVGEQFALPEALDELRGVRNLGPNPEISRVSATDPLNLVGVLSPGPRVPAIVGNAVLYVDGQPVASLEGGEVVYRAPIAEGARIDEDLTYHPPPRPVVAASQAALPL
jgi:hypothetical protein